MSKKRRETEEFSLNDELDEIEIQPEHTEHSREIISDSDAEHNWYQRGVEMICDGDAKHYAHGFRIPAKFVFRGTKKDGSLKFENVKEGGETTIN